MHTVGFAITATLQIETLLTASQIINIANPLAPLVTANVQHHAVISNLKRHSIANLKEVEIYYHFCVRGSSSVCCLNCETTIKGKVTITETMGYFEREL